MTTQPRAHAVAGRDLPAPGTWQIDPQHTAVSVVARHLMVAKVRGTLSGVTGTVQFAEEPEQSRVEVSIDASTVDTGVEQRDAHLRSPDFLDVERYPTITFRSAALTPGKRARFSLAGDLTVRGVTRAVVLDVEYEGVAADPWGGARAVFSATGEIDREAFGMTWNQVLETGGVLVGRKLRVEIELQAVAPA